MQGLLAQVVNQWAKPLGQRSFTEPMKDLYEEKKSEKYVHMVVLES